jgi:hypothetical protein
MMPRTARQKENVLQEFLLRVQIQKADRQSTDQNCRFVGMYKDKTAPLIRRAPGSSQCTRRKTVPPLSRLTGLGTRHN